MISSKTGEWYAFKTSFFPLKIATLTCYAVQLLHTYIRNLFQKFEKYPHFRFTFHILIMPSKSRLRQPNSSSKRLAPMALFGPSPCWIHHLHPVKIWQWACFPFDKMGRGLGWIQVYMSDLSCVSLTYGWCCHCFHYYPTHSASMSNCLGELKIFWHTYRKISLQNWYFS